MVYLPPTISALIQLLPCVSPRFYTPNAAALRQRREGRPAHDLVISGAGARRRARGVELDRVVRGDRGRVGAAALRHRGGDPHLLPAARQAARRPRQVPTYLSTPMEECTAVRAYTSNCTRSRWCYSRSFSCGDRWRRSMCAIYGACVSHALVSGAVLCLPSQSDGCNFIADDRGFVRFRRRGWGGD